MSDGAPEDGRWVQPRDRDERLLDERERPARVDRECDPHQRDLPSRRAGRVPAEVATMTAPGGSVKKRARAALSVERALDDDTQREMERAAGSDERSRQLQVGSRVDEHPGVLVREAELAELLETPADDPLVLDRSVVRLWWMFRRRHTCSNERNPREF